MKYVIFVFGGLISFMCFAGVSDHESLKDLEFSFYKQPFRSDIKFLEEHLHDDFKEIISSGKVYGRNEVLKILPTLPMSAYSYSSYKIECPIKKMCKISYVLDVAEKKTMRSSIWLHQKGAWKLFFHQVTPLVP